VIVSESFERLGQPPGVVGVADVLDVPAVGLEARATSSLKARSV